MSKLSCLSEYTQLYPIFYLISNAGDSRGPIKNITVSGQALTAILDNLHPSFLYNIRIRANNSIGLGAPSHQVAAKLLEEGNHYFSYKCFCDNFRKA